MKKLLLAAVAAFLTANALYAQSPADDNGTDRRAIIREGRAAKAEAKRRDNLFAPTAPTAAALTGVGEADSFGKNAKFLGTAQTGVVYVYSSCDPAVLLADLDLTLEPDDRCFVVVPGSTPSVTFSDIGRITIPGKSVDNVVYFIGNNLLNYEIENPFANAVNGQVLYQPTVTLESTALNDPAAIDPTSGLPMNGSYTTGINATRSFFRTYPSGALDFVTERYASAATRGFSRDFFTALGLPPTVVNKIYNRPLTIKLNLRVNAKFVTFGQFLYSVRFFGN